MSSKFIYPEIINRIIDVCVRHTSDQATIDELQETIQMGEAAIVAVEEADIRDYLTDIEGKLELARFTLDEPLQPDRTKKIAQDVIAWLSQR
jgi:hypothetical protein